MNVLKNFKKKKQCEKCGCEDINRRHVPAAEHSKYDRKCDIQKEHFDMFCRGCSFTWAEQVIGGSK